MEGQESGTQADASHAKAAWFADLAASLPRLDVYGMAIVVVDATSGVFLGTTARARDLLGITVPTTLADLVDDGTIARPDLQRLADHLRALRRVDDLEPDSTETTHSWSDKLRFHRPGSPSGEVHLEIIVHRRPTIDATAAVVTLWLDDDLTTRPAEEPRDLDDIWAVYDAELRMVASDPGFADLAIDPLSQLGTVAWLYMHPDDVAVAQPVVAAVLDGRLRSAHYSIRIRALRGRWLPADIEIRRLETATGPNLLVIVRYINAARRMIPSGQLSIRQMSVVDALFAGLRVGQIAERHGVAVKTIRNQLAAIYRTLEVAGQVELLATYHPPAPRDPLND